MQNTIRGNGEHVIAEYLHRRSLGSIYNSNVDSLDKPMQIYKKPEVSLTTSSTGKNRRNSKPNKQQKALKLLSRLELVGGQGIIERSIDKKERVHYLFL